MNNSIIAGVILSGILLVSPQMSTAGQEAAKEAPVSVKTILQTSKGWDGSDLPGFTPGKTEMRIAKFKIQPGAKTSIHIHPLNGAGYILSGQLTMFATSDLHGDFSDSKKVKEITLFQGDSWTEAVHVWHYGINKGKEPVEFIVVFSGVEGTPPTMSAVGFSNEAEKDPC